MDKNNRLNLIASLLEPVVTILRNLLKDSKRADIRFTANGITKGLLTAALFKGGGRSDPDFMRIYSDNTLQSWEKFLNIGIISIHNTLKEDSFHEQHGPTVDEHLRHLYDELHSYFSQKE